MKFLEALEGEIKKSKKIKSLMDLKAEKDAEIKAINRALRKLIYR